MKNSGKCIIIILLIFFLSTPFLWKSKFQVKAEVPKATLTGIIFDRGVDIDGNGAYDFLEIGVQVNVTEAGEYVIEVQGLSDIDIYIGVGNSTRIFFDVGIQVVNIRLDGQAIFTSGLNPVNVSNIVLRMYPETWLWWSLSDLPLSRKYLYTEFDAPGAALTGIIFDRGIDVDENGLFDFLEVGVELNITEAGEYRILMYELSDNQGNLISGDGGNTTQTSLDVGIQVVNLRIDGPKIFASGLNPVNVSYIILENSMYTGLDSLSNVPLSREYLYTEFKGPANRLTGVITDRGIDTDEDGIFEYLEIGFEVNVTEPGTYIVQVQGFITSNNSYISVSAQQSAPLNVGSQLVYLQINGITIFASGQNPAKVSKVVLYDELHNFIGSRTLALSRTYSYTEFGKPVTVGVNVGDWAKYKMTYTWQSSVPNATEPSQYQEMRKIEYLEFDVQDINDATITILMSYHFTNGTDFTLPTYSANIATQFITFIIPSNLNASDAIPGTTASINNTIIRSYAGMNRNVNYLGFSFIQSYVMNTTQTIYWDKATGILCEELMETSFLTEGYVTSTSMSLRMIETNIWAKMSSELSCSTSQNTITQGESIVVSGSINASLSGKTVTLTYMKPDGSTLNRTATTGSDGSYSDSYTPDASGTWSVTASWIGDTLYDGATSSTQSITVNSVTFILFTPFDIALLGGAIIFTIIIVAVLMRGKSKKL